MTSDEQAIRQLVTTWIVRAGHTLTIFTKQNGKWLLTRDANMLTTVPPK